MTERDVLRIFLALVIISLSFSPYHTPRIGVVKPRDLSDVLLSVRHFTDSAGCPDKFQISFEKMLLALQISAGLKLVFQTADEIVPAFASGNLDCLKPMVLLEFPVSFTISFSESCLLYSSLNPSPDSPPPRG